MEQWKWKICVCAVYVGDPLNVYMITGRLDVFDEGVALMMMLRTVKKESWRSWAKIHKRLGML